MTKKVGFVVVVALTLAVLGAGSAGAGPKGCTTLRDGVLKDSFGNTLVLGYDQFGYNYQAGMFNGTFDGLDRKLDGMYYGTVDYYVDDKVTMKWSPDWLANVDCNGDGKLDRGTSGTSLGWTTNHYVGDYVDGNGDLQHYTYFAKIVWVGPGGSLWGQYEIVQETYNDPAGGATGLFSKVGSPGLGLNDQWTT